MIGYAYSGILGEFASEATVQVSLLPAAVADKPLLANLLQLYLYDMSVMTEMELDAQGRYSYPFFDLYWSAPDRHPFLICVAGQPAGFALVNRYSRLYNPFEGHAVAEFFVLRVCRRAGVGRRAAHMLFDRFPGQWEVASLALNVPAHAFWRSTIHQYTAGQYSELWLQTDEWRGHIQSFVARKPV